jgi:trk system potassium uptake protein TrkA
VVIGSRLMGKTLGQLSLCQNDEIQVLGFKRGPEIIKNPDLDKVMEIGDMLIVAGPKDVLMAKLKSL